MGFKKVSEGLPAESMFVDAKCVVSGDIFISYFDSVTSCFKNERGEPIVFGSRENDEWRPTTKTFLDERLEEKTFESELAALFEKYKASVFKVNEYGETTVVELAYSLDSGTSGFVTIVDSMLECGKREVIVKAS